MKPMHKRLYTALPRTLASAPATTTTPSSRVRSNSGCSARSLYTASSSTLPFTFFDSPAPPPSSRPGSTNLVISTRLAAEVKAEAESNPNSPYSNSGQHNTPGTQSQNSGPPPYSLAFSSGQSDSAAQLPSSHLSLFFPYPSFGSASSWPSAANAVPDGAHPAKRQRTRYHLDVGAYGIPKRSRGAAVAGRDGRLPKSFSSEAQSAKDEAACQAVQVGEDAYFVRDNAMGVADGVGGWSRVRHPGRNDEPSPSALFARRLMHYCCEEVDAALIRPGSPDISAGYPGDSETLHDQLEDSLEDLADGLDVLMILEKAFEKTMQAHVVSSGANTEPATREAPSQDGATTSFASVRPSASQTDARSSPDGSPLSPPEPTTASHASRNDNNNLHRPSVSRDEGTEASRQASSVRQEQKRLPAAVPLLEGSSTALLAILEHPVPSPPKAAKSQRLFAPHPRHAPAADHAHAPPVTDRAAGAVIRIAHLGDCMAMLIRGEDIVWRTEEMWWNFNTPVQLGPASATKPQDAQIFTLPVEEDDILILASDGLSDNLWDEDILDEVVRFRRSFLSSPISSQSSSNSSTSSFSTSQTSASGEFALRRGSLAGMLSEALCSRARCVSERRGAQRRRGAGLSPKIVGGANVTADEDDIPFGRRAREQGKLFHGGKPDDISVLVAVVSPVD